MFCGRLPYVSINFKARWSYITNFLKDVKSPGEDLKESWYIAFQKSRRITESSEEIENVKMSFFEIDAIDHFGLVSEITSPFGKERREEASLSSTG
jgi:hypothetical protein